MSWEARDLWWALLLLTAWTVLMLGVGAGVALAANHFGVPSDGNAGGMLGLAAGGVGFVVATGALLWVLDRLDRRRW